MHLALSRPLSRRTFLRGAGVTLALPVLNAMSPSSLRGATSSSAVTPPKRFAFIYTPNSYNQSTFLPAQTGLNWSLPTALQPLAPVQSDITLVTGLDRTYVGGTGVHAQCGACWLTSSPPVETLDGAFPPISRSIKSSRRNRAATPGSSHRAPVTRAQLKRFRRKQEAFGS